MTLIEFTAIIALIFFTYICLYSLIDRVCRCKEICAKAKQNDSMKGRDDES